MEGDYLPAGYLDDDQLSDYNSDDGIEWLNPALAFHFAIDDDDDFVIDEWVEQAQEEGWLGSDSDDDSDIVYTDGLPVKKIFVTNFQSECIPNDLRTLFSKFGAVTDVSILEGKSSRYAFVTFGNPEHACL
ncbi:hypothetical protein B566_EDAN016793 [Ephemera danica]|nr:hypothetical protein B566_EDAN016793 [Ephemera danica]